MTSDPMEEVFCQLIGVKRSYTFTYAGVKKAAGIGLPRYFVFYLYREKKKKIFFWKKYGGTDVTDVTHLCNR